LAILQRIRQKAALCGDILGRFRRLLSCKWVQKMSLRKKHEKNGVICPRTFTEGAKLGFFTKIFAIFVVLVLTLSVEEVKNFLERQKRCFRTHVDGPDCWCKPEHLMTLSSGTKIYRHKFDCSEQISPEDAFAIVVDRIFEDLDAETLLSENTDGVL
jgi:hypothetical protein